jgi:hypothetical protein
LTLSLTKRKTAGKSSLLTLNLSPNSAFSTNQTLYNFGRVADPGCYITDPNIFSSRIQTFFHAGFRILPVHKKWNANLLFSCFLCLNLCHSNKNPESEKNSSRIRIPDTGGKKHRIPDLQHWISVMQPKVDTIVHNTVKKDRIRQHLRTTSFVWG